MKRERAALVLGALGALVCLSVAGLGADPTPWKVGPARAHGVLGPLVRAADGVWDPGLLRALAVLGGVVVVLAWLAVLLVRDRRWLYTFVRFNTFFTNPPLCITEEELRHGFDVIDRGLAAIG